MKKIAIIDIGSNNARLVIVNILEGGYFMVLDELKESVRLGQNMERDSFLKPARVAQTIKTLKMFRRLCDSYNVEKIIAVGTSAVRRAKNQRSFLDEVQVTCGIKIKVLTAEEEARLVYHGVINSMDIPKGLILEIGGGSTKIIYYIRRNIIAFETLPFGAVTLTDLFATDNLSPQEQALKIEEFFTEQLKKLTWLKEIDPDTRLIGVGGSFRNLGKISRKVKKYPLEMAHNYVLPTEEFVNIYDMIKVLDIDKKMKVRGLSSGRADIIPSAFAQIKAFTDYVQIPEITISGCGLREGIMFNYSSPITLEKPISDVLTHSLNTLISYYYINSSHVEHVTDLSVQLFKQLRVLHKFPRQLLKILKIASMLYDCGKRIKYYNYHRHSYYNILNSNLYGVSHRDLTLAAFVVFAHRKDDLVNAEWIKYKHLIGEEDYDVVRKLGVILNIAVSLDRSMSGVVKTLNCDLLGDSVIMKTEIEGDAVLEIKNALGAASEFKKAFGKNLEIL
ncbi:MAG: Ppx/GppA phosphatase family protein [Clostridia bacterium]|nr:Ppx/GppA phosphatase family protein [Clostridia bacterium]